MTETTPIPAAALGVTMTPAPAALTDPFVQVAGQELQDKIHAVTVAAAATAASGVTAATPDGTPVHDVMWSTEPHPILKHFEYGHLPLHLAEVSKEFHALAHKMAASLPHGPEKSAGLRKLLESKDCMVRAANE